MKYCSEVRHLLPKSDHKSDTSGASTVNAGAPVKPSAAKYAAETPATEPQPEPSFTIVWGVYAAHHLASGSMVLGNTQRLSRTNVVQAQHPGAKRRRSQSYPRAGRMVIASSPVQRNACACSNLVANHQASEKGTIIEFPLGLRHCHKGR